MDPYDATKIVFTRIQNLDPENASKIMGLLLIQDHGEKEMIRLAFGPENLLHSLVVKAWQELGISSNTPTTPSTPSSPSPFRSNNTHTAAAATIVTSSSVPVASRFLPNGINIPSSLTIPSLSSPSVSSPSWGPSSTVNFSDFRNPEELSFIPSHNSPSSYFSAAVNGNGHPSSNLGPNSNSSSGYSSVTSSTAATSVPSSMNSATPPFYPSGATATNDLIDEIQLKEQLSFLNAANNNNSPSFGPKSYSDLYYSQPNLSSSPVACSDSLQLPSYNNGYGGDLPHRRSYSVSEINLGSALDDPTSGFGWKPCLYYAKGYCKNGSSCRFVHGEMSDVDAAAALMGSPTAASKLEKMEQCHELLRSKSMQQQKLIAAMASSANPNFPFSGNKCLDFLLLHHQNDSPRASSALMVGEDIHNFGRSRLDRSEFLMNGWPDSYFGSRQIYLTFPADSTFREEDVSNYFSIYGPVQDVRIPYQQKRMFGFVTFVYPETVKMILAKGNPHFVCDARVLVKPYKEKGKIPEKYRKQHQLERGEFSACNSPTALDSRDPFDLHLGARMLYNNTQEMLLRRKLEEQSDLQQALELQNKRLMGLQLLDVKRNHHHRTLSTGGAISSPTHSPNSFFHHSLLGSDRSSPEAPEENGNSHCLAASNDQKSMLELEQGVNGTEKELVGEVGSNGNCSGKESSREYNSLPESLDHNLPDSPFASPTKAAAEYRTAFSSVAGEADIICAATASVNGNLMGSSLLPATSSLDVSPFKSCYLQMPRFSPGHGAIGM